jgi:hypothetical protein
LISSVRRRRNDAGAGVRERGPVGLAVDVVLGDQRLRRGRARRLRADRAEIASGVDGDDGALLGVDVQIGDAADVDARDAHVGSGDDAEGVVQFDLVVVRVVGAGDRHGQEAADRAQTRRYERDPPHGPGAT